MSVYYDILDALASGISLLNLDGFPTVVIRKKPHVTRELDGALIESGIIVVSPSAEIIAEEYTENTINIDYPVHVTFVQGGNGIVGINPTSTLLAARQAVRRKFHKASPLPSVTSGNVFDSRCFMSRAFDPYLFPANYDASQLTFIFKSTEVRSE